MADLDDRLSVLTGSFGDPPPTAELEQRVVRRRRRRWTAQGLGGVAAVLALVAGAVALTGGGEPSTTVRAASQGRGDNAASSPPVVAALPGGPFVVQVFTVADQRWELIAQSRERGSVCLALRTNDAAPTSAGCFDTPTRFVEATATDMSSFTYVAGVVAKDVVHVQFTDPDVRSGIRDDLGFSVNFFGQVVRPAVEKLSVTATKASGEEQTIDLPMPIHRRVDSVNGEPVRPTTTAVPATAPPTRPADPAPTTTAPPVTRPAPTTTVPPIGGTAKRVTVTPGATNLRKHVFESAVATGGGVLVTFWDGIEPCSVLGRVDLVEAADKVTITIWTGTGPGAENQACIAIAQQKETVVALAAPLGSRTVVDGGR